MPLITAADRGTDNFRGAEHGVSICLIMDRGEPGHGPRLHRHPYDETWVVVAGNITFQAGEEWVSAGPGDIMVVPPDTPHKFINEGPGISEMVCIHASPTMKTTWLEEE